MGQLPATKTELRGEQGDIVMAGNGSIRGAGIFVGKVKLRGARPEISLYLP